MRVIGHYNDRVENVTLPIVVPAMLKNKIAGSRRKLIGGRLSKRHKDCPVNLLIMRQSATVCVFVG